MCGCRSSGSAPAEPTPGPSAAAGAASRIAPEFLPALTALERSLADGDDEGARRVLDRLLLRGPTGPTLAMARSFERVLRGRECLKAVRLVLVVESDREATSAPEAAREVRVWLVASSELTIVLRPGPATLRIASTVASPRGADARRVQSYPCPAVRELALEPGRETKIELWRGTFALPRGAVAARERFGLELRAGVLVHAGEELPAQDPRVESVEACAVAPRADGAAPGVVGAQEFLASVARRELSSRAALELAVRIPATDRERVLDGLSPLAAELSLAEVTELVPALRWLSSAHEPGGDAELWRAWLAERVERRERGPARPRLSLPAPAP